MNYPLEVMRITPRLNAVHQFSVMEMIHAKNDNFKEHVKRGLARNLADFLLKEKPSAFTEDENHSTHTPEIRLEVYAFTPEEFKAILDDVYEQGMIFGEQNMGRVMRRRMD